MHPHCHWNQLCCRLGISLWLLKYLLTPTWTSECRLAGGA